MDLLSLPFDQYQRYRLVQQLLEHWLVTRQVDTKARILDVGGFSRDLAGNPYLPLSLFLPDQDVWAYDLYEWHHPKYLQIDAAPEEFPDERFDVVTACDVLEHVPAGSRPLFIERILDAAEHVAIIIGPLEKELVGRCESLASLLHRKLVGQDDPWLAEHRLHGLPSEESIVSILEERSLRFEVIDSGYVHRWLLMMIARMYLTTLPEFDQLLSEINQLYNRFFYRADLRSPGYRKAFVVATDGAGEWIRDAARAINNAGRNEDSDEACTGYAALHLMAAGLLMGQQSSGEQLVDGQWDNSTLRGPIYGPQDVAFEVHCPEDRLCRIDLYIATHMRRIPQSIEVAVQRLDDTADVVFETKLPSAMIHDNHWHTIRFPTIQHSAGRRYRIRISAPDLAEDTPIALYADESGRPAYRMYCRSNTGAAPLAVQNALAREAAMRQELESRRSREKELETVRQSLENRLSEQQGRSDALSTSMEALGVRVIESAREAEQLRQEVKSLKKRLNGLLAELEENRSSLREARGNNAELLEELNTTNQAREAAIRDVRAEEQRVLELRREVTERDRHIAELEARFRETEQALARREADHRRKLEELVMAATVEE